MKYQRANTKRYAAALPAMLWLGLSIMGFSQNAPDDPDPYPPKNYPVTVLSSDRTFTLRKLDGRPPEKRVEDFSSETDIANRIIKVKDKLGNAIYQVAIPMIRDLAPKMERAGMPDGFKEVRVTRNGNLILRYYGLDEFYYSNTTKKFTMMPSFLKIGEDVFQCSGWEEFAEDLFFAHLGSHYTEGDGIAIYDGKTQKTYKLQVPANLRDKFVGLDVYDSFHAIVNVETIKKTDPRLELDTVITGEYGYHKIESTP